MLIAKPYNVNPSVATVVAKLCVSNDILPTGAPTSPIISNMILRPMDSDLKHLAARHSARYSRYADDLSFSFSCSKDRVPTAFVVAGEDELRVGEQLRTLIERHGFQFNHAKTRLTTKRQRQEVTGITINKFPNVGHRFVSTVRSMLHAWEKHGEEAAHREHYRKYSRRQLATDHEPKFRNVVAGKIEFIRMVRGEDAVWKSLAFRYSVLVGKPRDDLLRSEFDELEERVFVVENDEGIRQGSGVMIAGLGIVTNAHVLSGLSNVQNLSIFRSSAPSRKLNPFFARIYEDFDLALIGIVGVGREATFDRRFVDLKLGQLVKVAGFPSYAPGASIQVRESTIVGKRKLAGLDMVEVDTTIVQGYSGGAAVDAANGLAGLVTFGHEQDVPPHLQSYSGYIPLRQHQHLIQEFAKSRGDIFKAAKASGISVERM